MGEALGNLVALTLERETYELRRTTEPGECSRQLREWEPHLAFIDLDAYGGLVEVFAQHGTNWPVPILAFTRKHDSAARLSAIERGVDGIMEFPFTLDEIVLRPYALLRRAHGMRVPIVPKIRLDGLEADLIAQRLHIGEKDLVLTPIQQTLLFLLAANAGRVLSREELLISIWGGEFEIESNVVDRHIRELRVKLGDDWRTPLFIETVSGEGYRWKSQQA